MTGYAGLLLCVLLALDLYMVSTGRISACIRATVLQAMVLSALPFALGSAGTSNSDLMHSVLLAFLTLGFKALLIPWLLLRALRDLGMNREFRPLVSLHMSQFINGALVGAAFWIAAVLPWPAARTHPLAFGVGFSTLFVGLYMIVNRRRAISQVLGYIVAESGLLVVGWALLGRPSLIIELGVLLDVLVAIMVMVVLATKLDAGEDDAGASKEGGHAWRR